MFEYSPKNLAEITDILRKHNANGALIKKLGKNANDKNQVYSGSDFQPLHPYFNFEFDERVESVSAKKRGQHLGKPILEAKFTKFLWLGSDKSEISAKNLKLIIYPQYPEARLSGFEPITGHMPPSLSVTYTKENPEVTRYLLIARRGFGEALGMMIVNPSQTFIDEVSALSAAPKSKVWKSISFEQDTSEELQSLLSNIVSRSHDGCRLKHGNVIPFNGTQVCGFTLEQALGISPNSSKDGDFKGIELKTHTQKRVTLFTPEPDIGNYNQDFKKFMIDYGYLDNNGNYRLTGTHRNGIRCAKSSLTLKITEYDPSQNLLSQTNRNIVVGLFTDSNILVAGWSLARLLNCWGAKHNEVVYVPASKIKNPDIEKRSEGYNFLVTFGNTVIWCKVTSADKLLQAIYKGTIFLDPAPKYVPSSPNESKRRSQWRVSDIAQAVHDLYESVEKVDL